MRRAAVLGAGTMGAQIAAHLTNAGVPVLLLDLTADVARQGLERARKLKPDPFFVAENVSLITTGGFDTDLAAIADCEWILEAIIERLDLKQALLARVESHRAPSSIVSSNTSGIPIAAIAEGRSAEFRRHWVGTHFFNPPRYLKLLEIIPTADTDPAVVDRLTKFADLHLGKGVVIARDTPNFIANHIGMFGMLRVLETLASGEYSIEEIDAITGPAMGRPKSATFRTADIAGIDVMAHVVRNIAERLPADVVAAHFTMPAIVEELVKRGWVGEKSGQGFYKRVKGDGGKSEILALDPKTFEYRPQQKPKLPSLEAARSIESAKERVRTLFLGQDKVGTFLRDTLGRTLIYTASVAPDIATSIDDVDRAMRWGFGWDMGPFELWNAIGIKDVLAATGTTSPPALVQAEIDAGRNTFRDGGLPDQHPELAVLRNAKAAGRIVKKNPGASLLDIGDGVLCLEFHSKMNSIGGDTVAMMVAAVKEAEKSYQGLVIGTDAPYFSAGANLMLLLLEAQEGNWDDIDLMIRSFQNANLALRYANVPVVAAPAGVALAGGCEVLLHTDRIQAAAETYIGLVEVGVGLVPAGGGTKEMTARAAEGASLTTFLLPRIQSSFENIGMGKVATSAADARRMKYLRSVDGVTMNRDRVLADARATVLQLAAEGYQPPPPRHAIVVGGEPLLASLKLGMHLMWRAGYISDYDKIVGTKLAHIMAGGALPSPALVSERYLLDLEREAFLSLCGERKTQERIQHMLKTGRPLRN